MVEEDFVVDLAAVEVLVLVEDFVVDLAAVEVLVLVEDFVVDLATVEVFVLVEEDFVVDLAAVEVLVADFVVEEAVDLHEEAPSSEVKPKGQGKQGLNLEVRSFLNFPGLHGVQYPSSRPS